MGRPNTLIFKKKKYLKSQIFGEKKIRNHNSQISRVSTLLSVSSLHLSSSVSPSRLSISRLVSLRLVSSSLELCLSISTLLSVSHFVFDSLQVASSRLSSLCDLIAFRLMGLHVCDLIAFRLMCLRFDCF